MNILILSWRGIGHPHEGGAEQSTHEHAKAWVKAGHKVFLFTSHYKGGKRKEIVDGVVIRRYGWQFLGVHAIAFMWYLFGKHPRFDLVVDQFHGIPFFTPLYVRVKKLGFIHETTREVWFLYPWPKPFNLIAGLLGYLLEPLIFRLFYWRMTFMTVSESTKHDLVSLGILRKNITVIHNGVTLDLPKKLPAKEEKKTAIYLGALAKDKGIEDALETFALINKNAPNWQFWVVGKSAPDYFSYLKNRARKLKLESKIKFWGFVNQKKKFELLARAHVLINPSIREGWGLVNIEANVVGTPVVGYKVSGVRNSVKEGKTGFLTEPRDSKKMVKSAMELLGNKFLYRKLSKNSMKWGEIFTWHKASKKSLKLIAKVYESP